MEVFQLCIADEGLRAETFYAYCSTGMYNIDLITVAVHEV